MLICFGKCPLGYLKICKICYILLNGSLEKVFFTGSHFKIFYNSVSGLYNMIFDSEKQEMLDYVCVSYDELINKELLLMNLVPNFKKKNYFKSVPFDT